MLNYLENTASCIKYKNVKYNSVKTVKVYDSKVFPLGKSSEGNLKVTFVGG